jgi:hypothetical protein
MERLTLSEIEALRQHKRETLALLRARRREREAAAERRETDEQRLLSKG